MLRPSSLISLLLIAVGCSFYPNAITTLPTSSPTAFPVSPFILPAATTALTLTSTPTAATMPPRVGVTRIIVLQLTPPISVAGPSPSMARMATPSARTGWLTYANANLHLAVDYPPDWTVRSENAGAIFSSPQGVMIQLDLRPSNLEDEILPNTHCTNSTNLHSINVRTCLATIGFSLDTYLDLKPAGAAETTAIISTRSRAALDVVNALIESARTVP